MANSLGPDLTARSRRRLSAAVGRAATLALAALLSLVILVILGGCTAHTRAADSAGSEGRSTVAGEPDSGDTDGGPMTDGLLPPGVPFEVRPAGSTGAFSLVVVGPVAVAAEPSVSGSEYFRLGMKVEVRPGSSPSEIQLTNFAVSPSQAPEAEDSFIARADQNSSAVQSPESTAAIAAACHGLPTLDVAAHAAGSSQQSDGGWYLDATTVRTFTGCLTFRYQGTPTGMAYLPADTGETGIASAWWPVTVPKIPVKTTATVLGRFDGTGNRVVSLARAGKAASAKICWSMTGTGRNAIDGVTGTSTTSLVATVGAVGGCQQLQPVPANLRIVGSPHGDWSIILTDY